MVLFVKWMPSLLPLYLSPKAPGGVWAGSPKPGLSHPPLSSGERSKSVNLLVVSYSLQPVGL